MKSIHAIFENGVFRPLVPVDLPDQTRVLVGIELETETHCQDPEIQDVMNRRYHSGFSDTSSRHDEHQP